MWVGGKGLQGKAGEGEGEGTAVRRAVRGQGHVLPARCCQPGQAAPAGPKGKAAHPISLPTWLAGFP